MLFFIACDKGVSPIDSLHASIESSSQKNQQFQSSYQRFSSVLSMDNGSLSSSLPKNMTVSSVEMSSISLDTLDRVSRSSSSITVIGLSRSVVQNDTGVTVPNDTILSSSTRLTQSSLGVQSSNQHSSESRGDISSGNPELSSSVIAVSSSSIKVSSSAPSALSSNEPSSSFSSNASITPSSSSFVSVIVPPANTLPRTVFVHLFEWQWADIALECENVLGPGGFAAVQVSPPQKSIPGDVWWTRYQPMSYAIEGRSGNRAAFANMVQRCKAVGVDIYVDAVINHMAAGGRNYPEVPYASGDFHGCTSITNFTDRWEVQNCDLLGLNDLATEKEDVRNKIAAYLNDLIGIGVAGFRIDAAKHMPASDLAAIKSKLTGSPYIFQEVIGAGTEPIKPSEYTGVGSVTEFNFTRTIGHYFKRRAPLHELSNIGTWSGWLPSNSAVVFVANHDNQRQDTDNTITHKDGEGVNNSAHIFALGWPYGYPKIMSSYEWADHDQGPPAVGANTCSDGWLCEHRSRPIYNMVQFRNYTHSVPYVTDFWTNGGNQIAWGRGGLGYVALNMEGSTLTRTFNTGMPVGTYCDAITGDFNPVTKACTGTVISVNGSGLAQMTVPPIGAVAIHRGVRIDDQCTSRCSSKTVPVTFTCHNGSTVMGQSVYVVGNIPELGDWNEGGARKLEPSRYPIWEGVMNLPANTALEWKCLKRNQYNPTDNIVWESGSNTVINSGSGGVSTVGSF
ncbi:MAG: alpha-amylase family glycosyl hydrolase [Fibrobacterales bacterium]